MAYIFSAEPGHMVYDSLNKKHFYFDEKGKFETDDKSLIERMKLVFPYIEAENSVTDDKPTEYHCKHCDYTTTNRGELLAHYREHKKEG